MTMKRTNYSSGAPLEEKVGYSRMVKIGDYIAVGGTTSVQPDGSVFGETAYHQTKYVLEKQLALIGKAGGKAENVFRVKIYATDMKFGKEISEAYSELFHDIRPLCTVVGTTALNRPTQMVEIEMEAYLGAVAE
jgi:enamine deaminase RidA (YjgF/YER057c/UK114 family)